MSDFIERLKDEKHALQEKTEKLDAFVNSEMFNSVSSKQQSLLVVQLSAMLTYGTILEERIDDLIIADASPSASQP